MDLDELLPVQAAASAALSNVSTLSSGIMSLFDSEDSSSDISEEGIMHFNSQLNRKNSIELFNNVFSLVGLSLIKNIRNRSLTREQVNIALSFIRQTAGPMYIGEEKEEKYLIDEQPNITMNEMTELANNFGSLVDRSEHLEKIKILTIAPANWGRIKITRCFFVLGISNSSQHLFTKYRSNFIITNRFTRKRSI